VDWIERIVHVDPDRGSGLFEIAILVFLVIAVSMLVLRVRGRAARRAARARDDDA
jgi:hypothetical protein